MNEDRRVEYDPSKLLTRAALYFVGILVVFVCFIIGVQIVDKGEANTESWAALTGIIGWATAQAQVLYSSRFGSTLSNTKKDAAITRIAESAAPTTALAVAASRADPAAPALVAPTASPAIPPTDEVIKP